jgi:phospholipid-binding lipoprotein MlaA
LNASIATLTVKYIDIRAGLLKASNILDDTVADKYSFVRDAYQLRREFLIYDGQPPEDFSEEELFKDENLFQDDELLKDDLSGDELLQQEDMKSNMELMDIETTPLTEPAVDQ